MSNKNHYSISPINPILEGCYKIKETQDSSLIFRNAGRGALWLAISVDQSVSPD